MPGTDSIPLQQHEFQLEVIESLALMKAELRGISERLDKINGSVARHEAAIMSHPSVCPLNKRVGDLEIRLVQDTAIKKRDAKWVELLTPAAKFLGKVLGIVVGVYLWEHRDVILQVFSKVK